MVKNLRRTGVPPTAFVMLLAAGSLPVLAQEAALEKVVVTAARMDDPLVITTDPKAPRQPIPAHDGADYLKTIPGFDVIRKGGTDGDPVLRGMAGSRINILLDGEQILGGCGNRMDPPTAYVFPESYDRVTVLKGPQTVLYGPGNSAGTVLFERDIKRFVQPDWKLNGSLTFGSFGRNDQVVDVRGGTSAFYAQGVATRTDADDYKDGEGRSVHSMYTRWSRSAAVGLTPDDDTRIELSAVRSDGKAAYADRTMDGVKFDRDNLGLKFEKRKISALVEKIEANVYYNYIDHVMDNYSLRTKPTTSMYMVSNPDRETTGGRFAAVLRPAEALKLTLGADLQDNKHTLRTASSASKAVADAYTSLARAEDANFSQMGVFGEGTYFLGERDRVLAGLRTDRWEAQDKRRTSGLVSAGKSRNESLNSGFIRYERDFAAADTYYVGFGHTERFPDYWELISASKESLTTNSAFYTNPEKTNQLDIGAIYNRGNLSASVSAFYNRIDDFILIDTVSKAGKTIVRNVDATSWGGEAGVNYRLNDHWSADGSLAYVRGNNKTDGVPLSQLPPLEMRLGATYDDKVWSAGGLLRLVAEQDRFAVGKGNIVGQDLGRTPGFAVFSANGSYRPKKGMLLAVGVDNLFDRKYAEHISRTGATAITGYTQDIRVNEPGRTVWVKALIALD
jgi:iron complex outermembrane receptor protein